MVTSPKYWVLSTKIGPKPEFEYDKRRGNSSSRGYNSAWIKAAKAHKAEHPLCIGCLAVGLVEPVAVTDHIVPGTFGTPDFWNAKQWQSSCKWHHDVVKQRLERMYVAGQLNAMDLRLDSPKAIALTQHLLGL